MRTALAKDKKDNTNVIRLSRWALFVSLTLLSLFYYTNIYGDMSVNTLADKQSQTPLNHDEQNYQAPLQFSQPLIFAGIDADPFLIADMQDANAFQETLYDSDQENTFATPESELDSIDASENALNGLNKQNNLNYLSQQTNVNSARYALTQGNNPTGGGAGGGATGRGSPADSVLNPDDLKQNSPTENPAAVPLPPALWLFGSAMLSLFGLRRKTTSAA